MRYNIQYSIGGASELASTSEEKKEVEGEILILQKTLEEKKKTVEEVEGEILILEKTLKEKKKTVEEVEGEILILEKTLKEKREKVKEIMREVEESDEDKRYREREEREKVKEIMREVEESDEDKRYREREDKRYREREEREAILDNIMGDPYISTQYKERGLYPRTRTPWQFTELTALRILKKILENPQVFPNMDPYETVLKGYDREGAKTSGLATRLNDNFSVELKENNVQRKLYPTRLRPTEGAIKALSEMSEKWVTERRDFSTDDTKIFIYVLAITVAWMVNGRFPQKLIIPQNSRFIEDEDRNPEGKRPIIIIKLEEMDFKEDASKPFKDFLNKLVMQASDDNLVDYTKTHVIDDLTALIEKYQGDYAIGLPADDRRRWSRSQLSIDLTAK